MGPCGFEQRRLPAHPNPPPSGSGVCHRPAPKAPQSPNLRWTHSLPVKKRPTPGDPK